MKREKYISLMNKISDNKIGLLSPVYTKWYLGKDIDKTRSDPIYTRSDVHQTDEYMVSRFYKPILIFI